MLFVCGICYDLYRSELPPGLGQPLKLRVLHSLVVTAFILGKILEKLNICSDLRVLRLLLEGLPAWKDSNLLIKDVQWDEVPVRIYQPKPISASKRKGILYFHGGAGTTASINSFERVCRYLSRETNSVVVSVDYRLAPEHPYPGQYWDCLNATVYFLKNLESYNIDPAHIIISGDSCGANFTTVICQMLVSRKDLPKVKIRAQVLIYPGFQGLDFYLPSYQQNHSIPILFRDRVVYFCLRYLNKDTSIVEDVLENCHVTRDMLLKYRKWVSAEHIPKEFKTRGYKPQDLTLHKFKPEVHEIMKPVLETRFSPLLAEDAIICQLPETFILTCEFDVLRDDGLLYKKRLEDNGIRVTWYHSEDGFHGVLPAFGYGIFAFPAAKKMMDTIVSYINAL
ncbi:arylacetamide deacetylase-like 4 [Alligator mississippiensis]|nr:arylacetamide deacetylase-like 4 [Alligator mississippiensis]